jgi:hypothetical protein
MIRFTPSTFARRIRMVAWVGVPVLLALASAYAWPPIASGRGQFFIVQGIRPIQTAQTITFPTIGPRIPIASIAKDRFEANDTYNTAANVPVREQLRKLSLPAGDVDFYRVRFTEQDLGSAYAVVVTTGYGLNVSVVVYRDSDRVAVVQTDPAKALEVLRFVPDVGSYTVQIADAGSDAAALALYTLEVVPDKAAEPPSNEYVVDERGLAPGSDRWENNWNIEQAPTIAMGQPIEANFVCPDPRTGCAGGDQDFYKLLLKPGTCADVGIDRQAAGVDTNIMLLDADGQALTGNDDRTVEDLRPLVRWCATTDAPTELAVLVGPVAPLAAALAGAYVLTATPVQSTATLTPTIAPTIAASATPTMLPTVAASPTVGASPPPPPPPPTFTPALPPPVVEVPPTVPQPTASGAHDRADAPPPTAEDAIVSSDQTLPTSQAPGSSGADGQFDAPQITDAPKGPAIVIVDETRLHVGPGARTEVIQVIEHNEQVRLFGQAKGAWVRVQPFTSVVPGWVYAADLRPLPGTIAGSPQPITGTATLSQTTTMTSTLAAAASSPIAANAAATTTPTATAVAAHVEPLEPIAEPVPPAQARLPVELTVRIVKSDTAQEQAPGVHQTPSRHEPNGVTGLRIQLVNAFGDVLAEGVTTANGDVTLTRDVEANTALFVQVPGVGILCQLEPSAIAAGTVVLTISLPHSAHF